MFKFFGKSYHVQYVALFLLGLILWSPAFYGCDIHNVSTIYNGSFAELINIFTSGLSPLIKTSIAYVIVFLLGILINRQATRHGIIEKNSLLVMLLFVVLSSIFPFNMRLGAQTVAGFLSFFLIAGLFRHDQEVGNIILSFDTGIIAGLIGLIYYPFFLLFIFLWFSLKIIGGVSIRNIMASTLGIVTPLTGEYLFYYFSGKENDYLEKLINVFQLSPVFSQLDSTESMFFVVVAFAFGIIGLFAVKNPAKLAIKQRKFLSILGLYDVLLVTLLLIFFDKTMIFISFPAVAIILGNVFGTIAGSKRLNILFFIVLLLILVNNWINCF